MREFEGKDLHEAIANASAALGVPAPEFSWEMVEEGRRGVFGLGARLVRIRVTEAPEPAPDKQKAPRVEPVAERPVSRASTAPSDPAKTREAAPGSARGAAAAHPAPGGLLETVDRMISLMGFRAQAEAIGHEGGWTIHLSGPDGKQLVKRDGEILDALEFLLNRMARRAWPEAGSMRVTCVGFRDRRDAEIVDLTRGVASTVARSGRAETLQEMNPYERRLVHLTIREFPGLVSRSEGEGFLKRVRVEKANG